MMFNSPIVTSLGAIIVAFIASFVSLYKLKPNFVKTSDTSDDIDNTKLYGYSGVISITVGIVVLLVHKMSMRPMSFYSTPMRSGIRKFRMPYRRSNYSCCGQ